MATSATIKIEGLDNVKIYKHLDGYPDATLPWLKKFNDEFTRKRGNDPQYKFAQCLRSSAFDCEKFDLDDSRETGWGVVSGSTNAEYNYILHTDGTVSY